MSVLIQIHSFNSIFFFKNTKAIVAHEQFPNAPTNWI